MGFCQKNQPICPGQNFQITVKNSAPLAGLVQKIAGFQFPSAFPLQNSRNFKWYLLTDLILPPPIVLHHCHPKATVERWQRARAQSDLLYEELL